MFSVPFASLFVCWFVCMGLTVPLENYFTHMETSQLPMKGCKIRPMLGTHGHLAVRVL